MALVLPSSIDYKQSLPALPDSAQSLNIAASPVNGSQFTPGSQIQFDLLNRGFLVPDSLYLSYSFDLSNATATNFWRATPVYTPFSRLDVQIGSQTVEAIQSYNLVMHLLTNTQLDVAMKYGNQASYGYVGAAATPTLEELDGKQIAVGTLSSSHSAPLVCMLTNAEKLIPLFAMPQIRLTLTLDSLASIFQTPANISNFSLKNVELRYKCIDMAGAIENVVLSMGDKLYIKSQSFACSSQTLPVTTGYAELIFNSRFASVKSLYAINGAGANGVNSFFDSIDVTSGNGDFSFSCGGVLYPQKPISTATAKTQALMELKSAVGSIYDRSNNMSINTTEFSYVAGGTTTAAAPAKFFVGTSTEKLNTDALLTGISTQNSPISYRINTGTSTGAATTVSLIVNYDALIEIDTQMRQASVKA
jgi:hypothetical protein